MNPAPHRAPGAFARIPAPFADQAGNLLLMFPLRLQMDAGQKRDQRRSGVIPSSVRLV